MRRLDPRVLLAGLAGVSVIAVIVVAVLVLSGGGDDTPSADEITSDVGSAIDQPGMVFHTVASDGDEAWLDFENEQFRSDDAIEGGDLVSVGEGWLKISFDPFANQVTQDDLEPTGSAVPRINNPAVSWNDALSALAFANQLTVIGRTIADGKSVLAVEAQSPVIREDGGVTGTLIGRVEIDPETNFPYAFERKEEYADGSTPTPGVNGVPVNRRIVYTTAELIPRDSLDDDFFDRKHVEEQALTVEENIAQIRDLGLTPLWLGETYEGEFGVLLLPPTDNIFVVTAESRAEIHYAMVAATSATTSEPLLDTVRIRLGTDESLFVPPLVPEIAGNLPEQKDAVTVNGQPAMLYTSTLSRADLGCDDPAGCVESFALLYRRLVFTVGNTAVQIEAEARIDAGGNDIDLYNSRDGIISLAESLFEAAE